MAAQAISSRDINALTGRSDPGLERGMPSPRCCARFWPATSGTGGAATRS